MGSALEAGSIVYFGERKSFAAGAISRAYGDSSYHVHLLDGDKVTQESLFAWSEDDKITGKPYDPTRRPWFLHAVEHGEGFTPAYPDPITGEGMVSYVMPIRDGREVLGVVVAGSFLDP